MKKNNRTIIWILGALSTVTPFAIDLYLPAFAQIAQQFDSTTATVSLSVSSYFIGMALGQILYGPFLDRFGRKPPLYVGLAAFIIASVGCTLSWSVPSLIGFRFLQALGGSVAWVGAVAMVRDFFPVESAAKMFSILFLIIGVSPLAAPTVGGLIVTSLGWQAVFIFLTGFVVLVLLVVFFFLPEGQTPDTNVSLRPGPMARTFISIARHPVFRTYSLANSFSFSTLFIYVASSPIIFLEQFHVSPNVYGLIFALLSVGFIGGGQINILLMKRFKSHTIYRTALISQVVASSIFLICVSMNLLNLYGMIAMFFVCLSCIGLTNPNGNALALSPFSQNVGSASALMGFTQIGVSSLASFGVGLINSANALPAVILMTVTSVIALVVLVSGKGTVPALES